MKNKCARRRTEKKNLAIWREIVYYSHSKILSIIPSIYYSNDWMMHEELKIWLTFFVVREIDLYFVNCFLWLFSTFCFHHLTFRLDQSHISLWLKYFYSHKWIIVEKMLFFNQHTHTQHKKSPSSIVLVSTLRNSKIKILFGINLKHLQII